MDLSQAKRRLKKLPGLMQARSLARAVRHSQDPFLASYPPGHFYSPLPDGRYVREHRAGLFRRDRTSLPGIDLREHEQIDLVKTLAAYHPEMPFPETKQEGLRYYFANPYFGHGSAIVLYSLMCHFRPRRLVEVGSGFSSAAMLDVNDRFFAGEIPVTFIEPYPERLYSLLNADDRRRHRILVESVQDVPMEVFGALESSDILFIDSSHVAKVGSDVVFLLTEVLPSLRPGVIVHVHDVYWPFEYPEEWVLGGTAWNEAYLLKAFLQFNRSFEILLFDSYLALHHQDLMRECLPGFLPDGGSSLWLRRVS